MFVGHYGVSFAARAVQPRVPLWHLFVAVQWLDVVWAPLVLLGVEKVRIVPGFTATNPLDLYSSSRSPLRSPKDAVGTPHPRSMRPEGIY
jgi:hypothetical protein